MIVWLLNHPSRFSWVAAELIRPLAWRRRIANAWWQLRHYGDPMAFREIIDTHRYEWDELVRRASGPTSEEDER